MLEMGVSREAMWDASKVSLLPSCIQSREEWIRLIP